MARWLQPDFKRDNDDFPQLLLKYLFMHAIYFNVSKHVEGLSVEKGLNLTTHDYNFIHFLFSFHSFRNDFSSFYGNNKEYNGSVLDMIGSNYNKL